MSIIDDGHLADTPSRRQSGTTGHLPSGEGGNHLSSSQVSRAAKLLDEDLTFGNYEFLHGNPTMSGVGTDTDWRREDGMYYIRVDYQRFELSEWLVLGVKAAP